MRVHTVGQNVRIPCPQPTQTSVFLFADRSGQQTEVEMSGRQGSDLCRLLAFLSSDGGTQRDKGPPVLGDERCSQGCPPPPLSSPHVKGICHEWTGALPFHPTGLSRGGPTGIGVSASALCWLAPRPPCRLHDWARQTS